MLRYYLKDPTTSEEYLAWVAPGAVRYDARDLDLLLPWLHEMREGAYPVEPSGGYIEGTRAGRSSKAYYEAACQVAERIDSRLSRTGLDRELVEKHYCQDFTDGQIASWYGMDTEDVRRRIRSAVSYIASGTCPRWLDCIDCPEHEKCRNKKHPPRKFTKQPVGINYRQWVGHRRYKARTSHLPSNT